MRAVNADDKISGEKPESLKQRVEKILAREREREEADFLAPASHNRTKAVGFRSGDYRVVTGRPAWVTRTLGQYSN